MIMFNRLPYFVILQGIKYKINVDFRNMISFENIMQDRSVSKYKKIEYALRHFYPAFFYVENYNKLLQNPQLYEEACEKLIWFYKCGREDYHKVSGSSKKVASKRQIFSYEYDDEYIYSAFYQEYGIDLSCEKIHWWKFKALLKSLKSNVEFVKIQGYRSYEGKDKNMIELRDYWELPKPTNEQERQNKIFEMLNNM